ncbi:Receptor-type tyrosine-protein phosphatase F [Holothuria leucospilota]|uniref:Receptor-type tyrosine-protein phosphatase F n=1 Tax=Holothuria leucospilota TaxID=206669 RepID=A0A9Q1BMB9_HOLLE|nr:Receptor-type tyrosine-protein phosphatase F [Holothuria leucospilota]
MEKDHRVLHRDKELYQDRIEPHNRNSIFLVLIAPFYNASNVISFTEVTPTSINVTWPAWDNETDVGSGPISGYSIQIKEARETQFRSFSVGKRLSYLFENLTENTEYDFRVVIFRDHVTHGEGPPSFAQRQRTLPRLSYFAYIYSYLKRIEPHNRNSIFLVLIAPFYNASNVISFTEVTPTSINVTWPAWDNETDVGSGPISGYSIQIKEARDTQFRSFSVGKRLSYLFENLTENTEYDFRVVIFRDHVTHGEGPPSFAQRQRTLPRLSYFAYIYSYLKRIEPHNRNSIFLVLIAPFYNASNVISFTEVTPTSINVTWPAWDNETDVGSGPISGYSIQIKEARDTQFRSFSVGKRLSYLFENLTENTEYDFRVVIFRDHVTHGEGPPSFAQRQRTLPRHVPSYSQSRSHILQFSDITSTSIDVTWPAWDQATDVGSGPVAQYQIQIKEKVAAVFRTVSAGKSLSYKFENLTEDTEYEFRVVIVSVHPNGEGPPSPTQSSKTPCGVHEEDVNLSLTTPTWKRGEVVVARWQIAERQESCGATKEYLNVELRDLDRCPTHSSETTESFNLENAARNRMILRNKKPNSLYKVTLSVAYGGGEFYNISDEIRTLDTEPTSAPENLRVEAVVGRGILKFEWTEPPCGGRNGVITKYQTSFSVKGRERKDTTKGTSKIYFGLKVGDRYTFKVKAETRYGRGPYTQPGCTSVFGTDRC